MKEDIKMNLVTLLEAFIDDYDVCIYDYGTTNKEKFVVYKGSIKQFLTSNEDDSPCRIYGDYPVNFIRLDKETGKLTVGI